jgi:hypothetical protein
VIIIVIVHAAHAPEGEATATGTIEKEGHFLV